ncbi:MAG: DinB family protein [Flavipsychrobacter sp.]|nr:DinB family protein [Flavipsychrobacter sp.]
MKAFFKGLFAFDKEVNEKMITTIIDNSAKVDERTMLLISHIVLVHKIWNNRMLQKESMLNTWMLPDLTTLVADNSQNNQTSLDILTSKDLSATLTYHNTKGTGYQNTYTDVLYHIINHNNYHRGQINARLKDSGIEPIIADYIFYKR